MQFRLLLVNSEIQTGLVFKQAAPAVGAELIAFESPELAARRIRDERFDGIFVDADIPNFSRQGFTNVVRNSKFNSQTPIILLTGYRGAGTVPAQDSDGVSRVGRPSRPQDLLPFLKELKRKLIAERRKNRRLSFRTEVNCIQGSRRFRAMSVNLSAQGMLLEVAWPLEKGDELEVHFQLASEDPVFRARVRVVRASGPGRVGLTFQNLGNIERLRLREFLEQHLPLAP